MEIVVQIVHFFNVKCFSHFTLMKSKLNIDNIFYLQPPQFWMNAADWAFKHKFISCVAILGTVWLSSYNFRTPQIPAMRERLPPEVAKAADENSKVDS